MAMGICNGARAAYLAFKKYKSDKEATEALIKAEKEKANKFADTELDEGKVEFGVGKSIRNERKNIQGNHPMIEVGETHQITIGLENNGQQN